MNEFWDSESIRHQLKTRWLGQNIYFFTEIDSTNTWLKEALHREGDRLPPGTAVITDYQKQGRGRFNRRWEAPPGTSLLLSLLFRPQWPAPQNNWLGMVAGLALVQTIESQTGVTAGIKWPNDIVIACEGEWRKVCGLLLEGEMDAHGRCLAAVLGIGLNVNIPAGQLPPAPTPPTSLLVAAGRPFSRLRLLAELLARLERGYEGALAGHSPQPDWQEQLITIGQPVRVTDERHGRALHGIALGVNEWGQLIIQDSAGKRHTILAGDVTLRGENFDNLVE